MTSKEIAVNLIKVYVLRGETIKDLKSGKMGSCCDSYSASISGYYNNKYYDSNKIVVDFNNSISIYKLKDIYDEIIKNNIQTTLL